MSTSESKLKSIAKYDKENYQHISFKARIGSRNRIREAAEATGQSINGFIKTAISNAVMDAIGKPLESREEKTMNECDEYNTFEQLFPDISMNTLVVDKSSLEKLKKERMVDEVEILNKILYGSIQELKDYGCFEEYRNNPEVQDFTGLYVCVINNLRRLAMDFTKKEIKEGC